MRGSALVCKHTQAGESDAAGGGGQQQKWRQAADGCGERGDRGQQTAARYNLACNA